METRREKDKWGKVRTVTDKPCLNCGGQFTIRMNRVDKRHYCSHKCRCEAKSKHGTTEVSCAYCFKTFSKVNSRLGSGVTKSGLHFCSRLCKDQAQRLGGLKEIQPPHYGTSKTRSGADHFYRDAEKICVGCQETKEYLLSVHHIDGDMANNKDENLEIVCGNCHIKRHLKLTNGVWLYHTASLTPRELIDTL